MIQYKIPFLRVFKAWSRLPCLSIPFLSFFLSPSPSLSSGTQGRRRKRLSRWQWMDENETRWRMGWVTLESQGGTSEKTFHGASFCFCREHWWWWGPSCWSRCSSGKCQKHTHLVHKVQKYLQENEAFTRQMAAKSRKIVMDAEHGDEMSLINCWIIWTALPSLYLLIFRLKLTNTKSEANPTKNNSLMMRGVCYHM